MRTCQSFEISFLTHPEWISVVWMLETESSRSQHRRAGLPSPEKYRGIRFMQLWCAYWSALVQKGSCACRWNPLGCSLRRCCCFRITGVLYLFNGVTVYTWFSLFAPLLQGQVGHKLQNKYLSPSHGCPGLLNAVNLFGLSLLFPPYVEHIKHRRFFSLFGSNCFDSRESMNVPGEKKLRRQSRKFPVQLHPQKCYYSISHLFPAEWERRLPRTAAGSLTWSFWTKETSSQNRVTNSKYLVPIKSMKASALRCVLKKISSWNSFDRITVAQYCTCGAHFLGCAADEEHLGPSWLLFYF